MMSAPYMLAGPHLGSLASAVRGAASPSPRDHWTVRLRSPPAVSGVHRDHGGLSRPVADHPDPGDVSVSGADVREARAGGGARCGRDLWRSLQTVRGGHPGLDPESGLAAGGIIGQEGAAMTAGEVDSGPTVVGSAETPSARTRHRVPSWCWCRPSSFCPRRDRKSTRLNSSHGSISYAVFCLKK